MRNIEIQLPALKKYQTIASIAAVVGFLLGSLIPAFAFITGRWACPFGDGIFRIGGFALLTGVVSAAVSGNLVASLLIFMAKRRR